NGIGPAGRFVTIAATLALPIWILNLHNVFKTWGNKAIAEFTRREGPTTGGYLFHVRPARAARMPAMFLFTIGLLLLLMSSASFWVYLLALVFFGVGCTYVAPGARYRRPAIVTV